jgi:Spy/CpxP family protein refolding chaperone
MDVTDERRILDDEPLRHGACSGSATMSATMSRVTGPANRIRRSAAAALVAWTASGCGAGAGSAPQTSTPPAAPPADDVAAGVTEHHRYHHHGGVTLFIEMSLDTMGVSPEQRAAVEKIRAALSARLEPARVDEHNVLAALADGLESAAADNTKVDAALAQLRAAAADAHDASADALNELHAVLTAPQRAALVDKVESHWSVWEDANGVEGGAGGPHGDRLSLLTTELELTPDQLARIQARLDEATKAAPRLDAQEVTASLRAFGDAFRQDSFDARAQGVSREADEHMVGWGAARMARLVEAAGPVLTPAQRATLAQKLREHASHNPSAPSAGGTP